MSEATCPESKYPHQKVQARLFTGDPVMNKRYVLPLLLCFAGLPTMATATESATALEDLAEVTLRKKRAALKDELYAMLTAA